MDKNLRHLKNNLALYIMYEELCSGMNAHGFGPKTDELFTYALDLLTQLSCEVDPAMNEYFLRRQGEAHPVSLIGEQFAHCPHSTFGFIGHEDTSFGFINDILAEDMFIATFWKEGEPGKIDPDRVKIVVSTEFLVPFPSVTREVLVKAHLDCGAYITKAEIALERFDKTTYGRERTTKSDRSTPLRSPGFSSAFIEEESKRLGLS